LVFTRRSASRMVFSLIKIPSYRHSREEIAE